MADKKKPSAVSERLSGILVHPVSFPSPYGIGDLGPGAYEFIDYLKGSGQHLWQVLPIGPTGFGDSPYQGPSAFAGQTLLISPQKLVEMNLLTWEDLNDAPQSDPHRIDYGPAIEFKNKVLRRAYASFRENPDGALKKKFDAFCTAQGYWLEDYSLFMALKDEAEGRCWLDWDEDLRSLTAAVRKKKEQELADEIRYYRFIQFLFEIQWDALRDYAHEADIKIIGDIPIFVAIDSCDVWANKKFFQLDSKGFPTAVAGVPPDYFSATGQLWGNPLYDWDAMEKDNYSWWTARVRRQLELTDILRIDHFRGFESYWSIPADEETAINGKWIPGPGPKLFNSLKKQLGDDLPIIAEDLGIITPEVEALRDKFGFPGMKVLQFGFENMQDEIYIPHFYETTNCICYTGTHDNDTTMGWYENLPEEAKDRIRRYGNTSGQSVSLDFIRFAFASVARYAIFPIQDLLVMGSDARMNRPGVAASNWSFRYTSDQLTDWHRDWLLETTKLFGRKAIVPKKDPETADDKEDAAQKDA